MSKKGKNIFFAISISAIWFVFFISTETRHNEIKNEKSSPVVEISNKTLTHIDSVIAEYSDYFKKAFDSAGVPGAAMCIVSDTQVVFTKTYGVKKSHTVDFVDKKTVFRLASVSKGFAALLTSILVDEGVLHWDDKVTDYLPDLRFKDTITTHNLTIRHLLSHTTGLVPHAYDNFIEDDVPFDQIINSLEFVDVCCPPGETYGYQNVIYSLIAEIIKIKTGKDYDELLAEKVFKPFGMKDASANFNGMYSGANYASPHIYSRGDWKQVKPEENYYAVGPAAGVNASIEDMGEYIKGLLATIPDPQDTTIENNIFFPQVYSPLKWTYTRYWDDVKERYYGLGWRIYKCDDRWIVYHGGYVKGYRAEIALLPDEKIGIALLMNGASVLANQSVPYFFNRYFNKPQPFKAWEELLLVNNTDSINITDIN